MRKVKIYGELWYLKGTRGNHAILYYQGKEMLAPLVDVIYLDEEQ